MPLILYIRLNYTLPEYFYAKLCCQTGKRYFTCTKDGHPEGKCWCKVNRFYNQKDYEYMKTALHPKLFQPADRDWGECPCPTTTVYGEFDNWQSWSSGCECRQSQHRVRSCKFPADVCISSCYFLLFVFVV